MFLPVLCNIQIPRFNGVMFAHVPFVQCPMKCMQKYKLISTICVNSGLWFKCKLSKIRTYIIAFIYLPMHNLAWFVISFVFSASEHIQGSEVIL